MDIADDTHRQKIDRLKEKSAGALDGFRVSVDSLKKAVSGTTKRRLSSIKQKAPEIVNGLRSAAESLTFARYGGTNIIVVEDDEVIRKLMLKALTHKGFKVSYAYDGEVALKQIESGNYGLAFLDIRMPKVDGFEVVRKVREDWKMDIEIVVISARQFSQEERNFLEGHGCMVLEKPINFDTLLKLAVAGSNRTMRARDNGA